MPTQLDAKFQEGLALHQKGESAQAQAVYQEILEADPDHFDALHLSGILALQSGEFHKATNLIGKALTFEPENPNRADAYSNYSITLRKRRLFDEALGSIEKALSFRPKSAEFHTTRGNILSDLGRINEAVNSYSKAIALEPRHVGALYRRGRAFQALGLNESALESFVRARVLAPDDFDINNGLAVTLSRLNRHAEALESYDALLRLKPNSAAVNHNRANALMSLGRSEEALAGYTNALETNPRDSTYASRAGALMDLKRPAEAVLDYNEVLRLNPGHPFALGLRLHAQMSMCDWDRIEARTADVLVKVARGEKVTPSWPLLAFSSTPGLQRRAAEIWTKEVANPETNRPDELGLVTPQPGRKIRVGYFSSDYREHPVAFLFAGVIEAHDRQTFEVIGFSYGRNTGDAMRKRLEKAFDKFIDVADKPDREICALARQHNLDIAVDLVGYTTQSRPGIFALRAAPVQVNFLGYPGTMGASFMDYIIADTTVIPASSREYYSEKVVHMPGSYQANDRARHVAEKVFTRAELGLPEKGFVFCCFNNNFKITPSVFNSWMRIMTTVPDSVLWLLADNADVSINLRKEAVAHGVAAERLVFAPRVGPAEHLARHRAADLFLDTLPYTAHTTASDALWAGVPIVTCTAESFAARVAASLLKAVGLPELVTSSPNDYEALAIALARDPSRLAALKQKLTENRMTAPLFDTVSYTRALEAAFRQMQDRQATGLGPDHIVL